MHWESTVGYMKIICVHVPHNSRNLFYALTILNFSLIFSSHVGYKSHKLVNAP